MLNPLRAALLQRVQVSSPRDTARSDRFCPSGCLQANGQSPWHPRLHERTRSQGPFLRRSYPASTVIRPCPTPARSIAVSDVEAATSDRTGLPRLPASPFPRAAPNTPADRMAARVDCFAIRAAFPVLRAGRHPHLFLSRPAQTSLTLRPAGSLNRPRRPLSRGFNPASRPAKSLVSYQVNRQFPGWNLPPLVKRAFGAHLKKEGF